MSKLTIEVAPRAREQLVRLARWWQDNSGRPWIVDEELEKAFELLSAFPEIGAPYAYSKRPVVRRLLLSRARVYVYYRVNAPEGIIRILAFWHTARGQGPQL